MKYVFVTLLLFALNTSAQTANIKDIPVDGDTNISITKGGTVKNQKDYEIVEEKSDLAGEPEVLSKEARVSWKKACTDWKAEFKELNKENKVLSVNCGNPTCSKSEHSTTTCTSSATSKVKVKIN